MASAEEGLDENCFLQPLSENLRCAICMNVLNQPMQCVRNEHCFCQPCITRYVRESPKCPTCREHLTVETLRPARLATQLVSQLILRCNNSDRGCPATMKLEDFGMHVRNCEFRPVRCSNEGCEMKVNSRDQAQHETSECRFRRGTCPVCGEDVLYARKEFHCFVTRTEMNEVKRCLEETRDEVKSIKDVVSNDMVTVKNEIATGKGGAKGQPSVRRELQEGDKNARENLAKKDQKNFNQEMQRPLFPCTSLATRLDEDTGLREDIIVAGGVCLKSVESFSWLTGQWTHLPDMMLQRWFPSSFFHQHRMFVYGGRNCSIEDSIEVLSMSENGARWKNFPGKLPPCRYHHASVVYEDYLFIFGGFLDRNQINNDIYKVCLIPPYSCQVVCHLPEPRAAHGAQRFGEKVVIVGGTTQAGGNYCLDSVVVYDIGNNCCQTLPPLPFAVRDMAIVAWRDYIIVVGGQDKNGNDLNTVVSYDIRNGKSKMLPPMKSERSECTAVVTGNILVVMGGGKKEGILDSVESFNFYTYSWEDLPPMRAKRAAATAVLHCN